MSTSIVAQAWLSRDPQAAAGRTGGDSAGGAPGEGSLAWRRALEEAQQADFSGWFGVIDRPSPQSLKAHMLWPPVAAAMRGTPSSANASGADSPAGGDIGSADAVATDVYRHRGAGAGVAEGRSADTSTGVCVARAAPSKQPVDDALPSERNLWLVEALSGLLAMSVRVATPDIARDTSGSAPLPVAPQAPAASDAMEPRALRMQAAAASASAAEQACTETEAGLSVPRFSAATSRPVAEENALHIHAEWSAQGVRIWLGAAAGQALPVELIATQLRRLLDRQGERLLGVVFNGHPVPGDDSDVALHGPIPLSSSLSPYHPQESR